MSSHQAITEIQASLNFGSENIPVARLVAHERTIGFEYDPGFIGRGLEISPIHLPLKPGVMTFDRVLFEGLPGVFNDSLPDGWGRWLLNRLSRRHLILPAQITPLDRLARIGNHGLGALCYEPGIATYKSRHEFSLDRVSSQARMVLREENDEMLQELLALNGSLPGARPKAHIAVSAAREPHIYGGHHLPDDYSPWIVKFANVHDGSDAGAIEYVYTMMAQECGVVVPEVCLFPAAHCAGYFATKRFDRKGKERYHMHSACGLLHSDFRMPSLDYSDLLALTSRLTRDRHEVEKMFRLAVFNVLAYNRDDHAKNFSFLMDRDGQWRVAPAYDLTFSTGPGGEQSTTVMGEGRKPGAKHLLALASEADITQERALNIIQCTQLSLARWPELAQMYGVSPGNIEFVASKLLTHLAERTR